MNGEFKILLQLELIIFILSKIPRNENVLLKINNEESSQRIK